MSQYDNTLVNKSMVQYLFFLFKKKDRYRISQVISADHIPGACTCRTDRLVVLKTCPSSELYSSVSRRYDSNSGGEREIQRTMLELLNQLDGFDSRGDVKVIMATNRIETLDPALIRPGQSLCGQVSLTLWCVLLS